MMEGSEDMKKKDVIIALVFIGFVILFFVPSTYAIYRNDNTTTGDIASAEWNVTLEQSGVNNNLTVVPGVANATYTLNVRSLSQVDVKYDVVLTNLPSGVEVAIGDGSSLTFQPASNGTITFTNVGTILHNAANKTNSHTLTFRGTNGATYVNNQTVTVSVTVQEILS